MSKLTASVVLFHTPQWQMESLMDSIVRSDSISTLFVIDNAASGENKAYFSRFPFVRYIPNHNNGYGAGHNVALQFAVRGADYHIVMNPDISFDKGTMEEIALFMDSHKDVGCVMPGVVDLGGKKQYLCKLMPTPMDILGRGLLPNVLIRKRNERFEMRCTGYDEVRNVPILSGCFMFLRVDILKDVGMFDERFFLYFEDFDLIRRIHRVSKTVFYPKVNIVHSHAAEHRTNKALRRVGIVSAIKYFNKWGWLFDKERRHVNKHAFDDENEI